MHADEVISLRKLWSRMNYGTWLPQATVLATPDWISYVQAMSHAVPGRIDTITYPREEDVLWGWPDGITLVFSEPQIMGHTIISYDQPDGTIKMLDEPVVEKQETTGVLIGPQIQTRIQKGQPSEREVTVRPVAWIGVEPTDIISAYWLPGGQLHSRGPGGISESSRLLLAIITALGHKLTKIAQPTGGRGERRRVARELPELRVLSLSSGASVSKRDATGREWSHRWMVRGHWRLQPYGPRREKHKLIWIDPFIKGPEDKPLDIRPTIWQA